jgi:hypothetical protein
MALVRSDHLNWSDYQLVGTGDFATGIEAAEAVGGAATFTLCVHPESRYVPIE